MLPDYEFVHGDATRAISAAPRKLSGQLAIGGQEHFYLEGQVALAIPGEDGDMHLHSSTQHPSETQHMIARALGVPTHAVTVEVRRMGGAFGGKESQGNALAIACAVTARLTGRPARMRGIGGDLCPVPALPSGWLVLANPGVAVPTPEVFRRLERCDNPPMPDPLPDWRDTADLAAWLAAQRNDLEAPARSIAPRRFCRASKRSGAVSASFCASARSSIGPSCAASTCRIISRLAIGCS